MVCLKKILSSSQIDNDKIDYYNNTPVGSILNVLFYENCIPALTIVIRKEALLKIGGFKQNFKLPLVDLPTIFELSLFGQFRFIDKVLGSWRLYSTQITKTYPVEMVEGFYELRKFIWAKAINIISPDVFTLDMHKFDSAHERKMVMTNSRAGRYELLRKNYSMARKYYFRSLFIRAFIVSYGVSGLQLEFL
ncbi:MAG: hypothetical protein IPN29_13765 [Saprospiraceae bacterium]|nr:hypothetical protein [Saprospiraceae bacterium]